LEEPDGAVGQLVSKLAASATVALGLTKWLMHSGRAMPLLDHHRDEAFAMELSSRSDDIRDRLQAFAEKREPNFEGR
jgi:2-(1,2-epoxy-1,2-dihydrophenyl)acetyl-CoA isomerase